jgi:MtfA peptidase
MFGFKKRRRERLRRKPFPPEWLAIVERNVPYFRLLSEDDRRELLGHVQVFIAEHRFEGCGGLQMIDEIRVTIAAQACLLLLHRETDYYPLMGSIVVYPEGYLASTNRRLSDGNILSERQARLGESWHRGPVVLSWDDVRRGAADIHDGQNVVLREFAHQLDGESGAEEGLPYLPRRSMVLAWARVLGHEYRELLEEVQLNHRTLLDAYGAKNPAEFFAVATEVFFEKPIALRRLHPELYEQLRLFYRQDPATRL